MTIQRHRIAKQNLSEVPWPKSLLVPLHCDCHPSILLAVYSLNLGKIHVTVILKGHFGCLVWTSRIAKDLEADVVFLQQRLANLQSQNGCASHGQIWDKIQGESFSWKVFRVVGCGGLCVFLDVCFLFTNFSMVLYDWSLLSVLFKLQSLGRWRSSCFQPRSLIDIPLENLCCQLPAADFMALSMAGGLV